MTGKALPQTQCQKNHTKAQTPEKQVLKFHHDVNISCSLFVSISDFLADTHITHSCTPKFISALKNKHVTHTSHLSSLKSITDAKTHTLTRVGARGFPSGPTRHFFSSPPQRNTSHTPKRLKKHIRKSAAVMASWTGMLNT